jgi:hypothetical protein
MSLHGSRLFTGADLPEFHAGSRREFPKCLGTIAALIGDGGADPKISGIS